MFLEQFRETVSLEPVHENNMNIYPSPPSSNEYSPQPVFHNLDNNSISYQVSDNYDALQVATLDILPQAPMMVDTTNVTANERNCPFLQFVEQPTDRFRFRYKSEMAGTHGSLTGIKSDKSRKQTYPTVELKNFVNTAIIRCSIYQHNVHGQDFMPHAHRLIMKRGKEEHDDPHDLVIGPEDNWRATFHGMGIIHTAKKNIVSELIRKKKQLKMEYIARMENKPRELTTAEKLEGTLSNMVSETFISKLCGFGDCGRFRLETEEGERQKLPLIFFTY